MRTAPTDADRGRGGSIPSTEPRGRHLTAESMFLLKMRRTFSTPQRRERSTKTDFWDSTADTSSWSISRISDSRDRVQKSRGRSTKSPSRRGRWSAMCGDFVSRQIHGAESTQTARGKRPSKRQRHIADTAIFQKHTTGRTTRLGCKSDNQIFRERNHRPQGNGAVLFLYSLCRAGVSARATEQTRRAE